MAYQLPLLQPTSDWTPPESLPDLSAAKRIAIDLETHDPNLTTLGAGWARGEGKIIGVAIAVDDYDGQAFSSYYPLAHENGGNLDRGLVMRWLRDQLSRPEQPKVFANAMYDVGWLLREGIVVAGPLYDVQIAAPLLDEDRLTYRLDALMKDCIGQKKDEKLLREAARSWGVDPKSGMWRMPANFVGPYAEQDAGGTLRLFDWQAKKLEEEGLIDLFRLETELLPLLIAMRWRGVRVDVGGAEQLRDQFRAREDAILDEIKRRWCSVDIWNAGTIARAFDTAGLPYPRTPKTDEPSFRAEWLKAQEHELPRLIVEARKMNKARSVFIENYILEQNRNGRLHPEFHPLRSDDGGTVSGRFSCSNPNLQNIPARDPNVGPFIRKLFLPEEGAEWMAADYSQQEFRLLVHYANVLRLDGAAESRTYYENDPDADYHKIVAEMAGIPRQDAKTINFGALYGMGKDKLATSLGIEVDDAVKLLETYNERIPFVKAMTKATSQRAAQHGVIRTIAGRRCRFNYWGPADFELSKERWKSKDTAKPLRRDEAARMWPGKPLKRDFTHAALNRLIQGSAADMTKLAMRDLWRAGIVPHLQIHDELDCSVTSVREAEQIMDVMKNAVQLLVPVRVDGKAGKTWGHAK